jgi:hypothetical protein
MIRIAPLLALLAACADGKVDLGQDSASDPTGDETTGAGADAPVVESVSYADCSANVDGVDTWFVEIAVSDPQGVGDIASTGSTVTVVDGGQDLATYDLACYSDACSGTWMASWDDIDCATGEESIFRFVVVDDFGNASEPYDYQPD